MSCERNKLPSNLKSNAKWFCEYANNQIVPEKIKEYFEECQLVDLKKPQNNNFKLLTKLGVEVALEKMCKEYWEIYLLIEDVRKKNGKNLSITESNIPIIPQNIQFLSNLNRLYIKSMDLIDIQYIDWQENVNNLSQLIITQTPLAYIPWQNFALDQLTSITITHCRIFQIEELSVLNECTQLTELNLSFNYLKGVLPLDLSQIPKLKRLELEANEISDLLSWGEDISYEENDFISNLQILNIDETWISFIPSFISNQLITLQWSRIYGTQPINLLELSFPQIKTLFCRCNKQLLQKASKEKILTFLNSLPSSSSNHLLHFRATIDSSFKTFFPFICF